MSDNKTDEQILREYNDCVYNSEIYKRYNSARNVYPYCIVTGKLLKFSKLLLLATTFYAVFAFFNNAEFKPFIYIVASIVLVIISKKKYVKDTATMHSVEKEIYEYGIAFDELKKQIPVPPIPSSLDNPQGIQEILAVFESKRADTFKEALIIYEQDCQHRELVRRQNALISAANAAQREAEEAKKAADKAKREADYARREADYYYWNNY